MKYLWLLPPMLSLSIGCSQAKFTAQKDKEVDVPQRLQGETAGLIQVSCQEQNSNQILKEVSGSTSRDYILQGELCHESEVVQPKEKLSVSFVVDFSLSMQSNDPVVNGVTCGRYEAVKTIVDKLKLEKSDQTEIDVNIIKFHSYSETIVEMGSIENLLISAPDLCQYSSSTNYEAAMLNAYSDLKNISGKKAVYFITDGMPTVGSEGDTPANRGMQAAGQLKSLSDLELYTVYLGNSLNKNIYTDSMTPEEYIHQLTGDSKNVKFVNNASELAEGIAEFELPKPVDSSMSEPSLKLIDENGESKVIALEEFSKLSNGRWFFKSKNFKMTGEQGGVSEQKLEVKVLADQNIDKSFDVMIEHTVL